MSKNKTTFTKIKVKDFINSSFVTTEQKKKDSLKLVKLISEWSGFKAKMWGPTIIGFGSYIYKYESGHSGEAPMLGFSPRKAELTLYVTGPNVDNKKHLEKLGKYKISKACIYIKKLEDIDVKVLETICKNSIKYLEENHECPCRE
jgi:hypothetical protein